MFEFCIVVFFYKKEWDFPTSNKTAIDYFLVYEMNTTLSEKWETVLHA